MIRGFTNVKFEPFFQFDINTRTWGHAYKLQKNRFNRDPRQHFYSVEQSWCTNSIGLINQGP